VVRIGIIGPIAWRVPPRHYGGWERVVHDLTEGLVRRGHTVTLFASGDSQTTARLESVVPRPLAEAAEYGRLSRAYETLHLANAFAHALEFDVLHNNAGCYAVAMAQLCPVPLVTTLHGSGAEEDSRMLYRRFADGPYVSISDSERRLVPELHYAATVYNGIDAAAFEYSGRPGEYLLAIGRMSPDKGIHLAISAARQAGLPLVLAGIVPSENEQYFRERIEPCLGDSVRFVGPVDLKEKSTLYAHARAFLHLVTYDEAFGLTMAEAMACGCPVIALNRGSVPEVVVEGETGFIVSSVEEAAAAVGRVGSLDRRACRAWVQGKFSVEQMVAGYEAVYEAAVADRLA